MAVHLPGIDEGGQTATQSEFAPTYLSVGQDSGSGSICKEGGFTGKEM